MLNKKETGLDNFGNSQSFIGKDAKIKRFTVSKKCSREKTEDMAEEPFLKAQKN